MEVPWTEIRVAAAGLGVSCLAALLVSIVGFGAAARRRTLGRGVVTFTGNLFLITVLTLAIPFLMALLIGPAGFFSSVASWAAVIVAALAGTWLGWRIALLVGAFGIAGRGMAGIHQDDYDPGPNPSSRWADPTAPARDAPFSQADQASPSVISGRWDMVEFKASTGRVDEALAIVEGLLDDQGDAGRARLRSLAESGRAPALAEHPRVAKLLGDSAK